MPLIAGFARQRERAEEAKGGKHMKAPEVSIHGVPPRGFGACPCLLRRPVYRNTSRRNVLTDLRVQASLALFAAATVRSDDPGAPRAYAKDPATNIWPPEVFRDDRSDARTGSDEPEDVDSTEGAR